MALFICLFIQFMLSTVRNYPSYLFIMRFNCVNNLSNDCRLRVIMNHEHFNKTKAVKFRKVFQIKDSHLQCHDFTHTHTYTWQNMMSLAACVLSYGPTPWSRAWTTHWLHERRRREEEEEGRQQRTTQCPQLQRNDAGMGETARDSSLEMSEESSSIHLMWHHVLASHYLAQITKHQK